MNLRILNTVLSAVLLCFAQQGRGNDFHTELKNLDLLIEERDEFLSRKLESIDNLKSHLLDKGSYEFRYEIYSEIAKAYKGFQCDSTLLYNYKMLNLAKENADYRRVSEAFLRLARTQYRSGMYEEAFISMENIDRRNLDNSLLDVYYWTYACLNRSKAYITKDRNLARSVFLPAAERYTDSLSTVLSPVSSYYHDIVIWTMRSKGDYQGMIDTANLKMMELGYESRDAAALWYNVAEAYESMGNKEQYLLALAKSAALDLFFATKDHASLHVIAQNLYESGDVNRAARYMQICMDDAMYYNANLRGIQIGKTLPRVMDAYNQRIRIQLWLLCMLVAVTALLLLMCFFFLMKTNRQHRQLKHVHEKLSEANDCLSQVNARLQEADYIKESYIAHFIQQNSDYIGKTHNLLLRVNKSLRKGNVDEALAIASISEHDAEDVASFYEAFDAAFLSIFPNYIEQFNMLLKEEYRYPVEQFNKKDAVLSSELRVYALVRLGFQDSATLAEMLRYSVNSIYNIRSKAKSKSLVKDNFEEEVRKIGLISSS